MAECH